MTDYERESLVNAYWEEYAHRDAHGGIDEQASCRVDSIVRGGTGAVDLLHALAEGAPDDKALAFLGAGPIEIYLLRGEPDIDAVDTAARRSRKFRVALTCAWFDDHLRPADAARLRRFGAPP